MVDQKIKQTLKVAAGMGKGDDRYVGHLAHGEIILSNAFQKEYPGLIDDLRKAFERVGINMNRYIVGHKENRINEDTGIAEFFEGNDSGGYGEGSSGGGTGSGGEGMGGGSGDGHGDGGDGSTPDTPVAEETPPPIPEKKPVIPLTPENTGIKLGYDPIPNASFTPATPPPINTAAAATMPSSMPATPQTNPFASGSTMFEPGQQPAFADGGIVDAALKRVSSKYSDTGLPLNAMQILSKIAKSG